MINPTNPLPPFTGVAGAAPLSPAPRGAGAGAPGAPSAASAALPASWFDADAVTGDTRISADLDPASRGLSVAQHAARVLQHLCGDRDAAP
jgi:hypothetical protein